MVRVPRERSGTRSALGEASTYPVGAMTSQHDDQMTFYEAVGGEETFTRLARRFFEGVAADPVLRPMFPEEDLGPAEERLRLFLMQYWGGPETYSERRGHPRLRMRHEPYRIGAEERDRFLTHMRAAVDDLALPAHLEQQLWEYLVYAAYAMVNVPEDAQPPMVQ
uniref:HEMOGLOBIN n=1 Tax=Thermobifida fusca TM51 TaxID=1169414 RepID=UPI0004F13E95|nr:Chain A, HEMOGLOBIN [Thermobifida fusca TM51]